MGAKYTSQTISGYNAGAPPDDGSTGSNNLITWAGQKTKLADPIKTLAEAINTQLVTALNFGSRTTAVNDSPNAADHMKTVECTATLTVTLPDATTIGAGYILGIANTGSGTVTVALTTATDTLEGTTNGTLTIPTGIKTVLKTNTAANGYFVANNYASHADAATTATTVSGTVSNSATGGALLTPTALAQGTQGYTLQAEVATTSGTSKDFTGLPSWATKIYVMFHAVSTSGGQNLLIQLGDAGGIETTGYYSSAVSTGTSGTASTNDTTGFVLAATVGAGNTFSGLVIFTLQKASTFTWVMNGNLHHTGVVHLSAGDKSTSQITTTIRITTVGSTDTFDAGAVSVAWE